MSAYSSPGVQVTESLNPTLAPLIADPSIVGLIGPASGYQSATENDILTGTTANPLRFNGINTATVVVKNLSGTTLSAGNYVITPVGSPGPSTSYTIARFGNPATSPTLATGTGSLTGTYQYEVTFVNSNGETGVGPASSTITVTAQGISLSVIPVGPAGTTARNIYRQKVISSVGQGYHLVATINDNTTTTLSNESTSDSTAANGATPPVGINSGDTILVSYQYTDQNYYVATSYTNFNDVQDKYGPPFDQYGNISSQLTFTARLLFLNGASEIVCVASASSAEADFITALATLGNEPEVRFVTVTSGATNVLGDVIAHVNTMNAQGYYRQAVLGVDGTGSPVTIAAQRTLAQSYNNQAIQLVNVTSLQIQNPQTLLPANVGGQYAAAAITGMWAGRDVQYPLTRKTVAGFVAINDTRSVPDLALDSAAGLCALQTNSSKSITVRHSVTTAVGDVSTREASVVRAKYEMAHQLSDVLDSSLIGIVVPATQAALIVQSAVTGILEQLILEGAIQGYDSITARLLPNDPSTVEVAFSYQPSFPINNISVVFTIDTTTGNLAVATQSSS